MRGVMNGPPASYDRGGAENSALDFAYLAQQTLGDVEFEFELLRAFQVQATQILRQLRSGQAMSACESANLAHLLKGSARAIGASRVGVASEAYERRAADTGDAADLALSTLVAAIIEVSDVIDRTLAKAPPT